MERLPLSETNERIVEIAQRLSHEINEQAYNNWHERRVRELEKQMQRDKITQEKGGA